jgi:hypothetical protein
MEVTVQAPAGMDPNLVTMRNANMHLIKQGKFAKTIVHAKSYLVYILGEEKMGRIDDELDLFVDHLHEIAGDKAPLRKNRKGGARSN